jgi:hypothetical protein
LLPTVRDSTYTDNPQDPKILFRKGGVPQRDHRNSRIEILNDFHQFSKDNPTLARITKAADVEKDWVYLPDRQRLKFQYRKGELWDTPAVPGGDREIYRNLPPAKARICWSLAHNMMTMAFYSPWYYVSTEIYRPMNVMNSPATSPSTTMLFLITRRTGVPMSLGWGRDGAQAMGTLI